LARKKRRILRKVLWGALIAFGIVLAVGIGFFIHLDRQVTKQFEGRRWTLPAQVFAAPLEIYAGLQLSGAQLEEELQRLQYREVTRLERPGS
jgi:penicillin-binding protein 1B